MSKSTYPLKLPNSIKAAAAEFLRERARDAEPKELLRYVHAAPPVPAVAGDEVG